MLRYFPQIGIEILIERSLITINWRDDKFDMHDLLQEMGRDIVFQESPNDPSRRRRLWSRDDIDHVLTKNKVSANATICLLKFVFSLIL